MEHNELIEAINNYLTYHRLTKEQFCILCGISLDTLHKIIDHSLYVSLHDYQKLASLLKLDILDVLT